MSTRTQRSSKETSVNPQGLEEQAEGPDPSADHIEPQLLGRDDEATVRNKALNAYPRGMESQRLEVQSLERQIGQRSQNLRWVPQRDRIGSDVATKGLLATSLPFLLAAIQ